MTAALLDTNAFLFWIAGGADLSAAARSFIRKPGNEIWVSLVTAWELAIKSGQGKIKLASPVARFVNQHVESNGFRLMGIEMDDVALVETLPLHHRDPFDRLLIAQAGNRKLPVVSSDSAFSTYSIKRIW
ncbi:MAG: type II toxin-antitoxin system VapC family toxin [Rhodocyclaceae bacterium]|nr:type II toxin-antitoxin system VapC family toxin [Rhodocyclaceae bacterium]